MDEVWKDVVGYEGFYQVSNIGRIKSLARYVPCGHKGRMKRETILKNQRHPEGYPQIELNVEGKKYLIKIHRLVAEAFIENPGNLPYINHINGKKDDNRVENLEWCTPSENLTHAFRTQLKVVKSGDGHHNIAIKSSEHPNILKLSETMSQRRIAKIYGVAQSTIMNILKKMKSCA